MAEKCYRLVESKFEEKVPRSAQLTSKQAAASRTPNFQNDTKQFYCGRVLQLGNDRWHHQGHPFVEGATRQTASREEYGSDRGYLNGLAEATALARHDQVRTTCHSGGEVTVGRVFGMRGRFVLALKISALNLSRLTYYFPIMADFQAWQEVRMMRYDYLHFHICFAGWGTVQLEP